METTVDPPSNWRRRVPAPHTLLELGVLLLIPALLAAVYYLTPQSFQNNLALDHTQPKLHAFWTTSFVHAPRPDDSHLLGNIRTFLMLIFPTWTLYRARDESQRFWTYLAIILLIGPLVINGLSYLFYTQLVRQPVLNDRGFSSIVTAIDGLLIASILTTVEAEQGEKVGALSIGLFGSFLFLGLGAATSRWPVIGLGVLLLAISFIAVQLGYFAQFDDMWEWIKSNRNLASILMIAAFVSAYAFAVALPNDITLKSDGIVNIASHGAGILFGMSFEFLRQSEIGW